LSPVARRVARRGSIRTRALLQSAGSRPGGFEARVMELADTFLDLGLLLNPRIYVYADPPEPVARVLLQATHEALMNARKYADADTEVVLFVEARPTGLEISVLDSGPGFDPASAPAGGGRTRSFPAVETVGARYSLTTAPGRGTKLVFTWPAEPGNPDEV
jgi:signal transduction histidine kinase